MSVRSVPSMPDEATIQAAAQRLLQGELVAFPTETVYGLGADAENPAAIAKIYHAKNRPQNHPVIVHIAPEADLLYWVKSIPADAGKLIDHFWPGPLTLILPRAEHIPDAVSGGQKSVGMRCPSHPVAQALLRAFARLKPNGQGGVAAPSANKFGQVSPTAAAHVKTEFPDEIAKGVVTVLEGSDAEIGIESTIVDLSRTEEGVGAVLLRPGHITRSQLASVLGYMPASQDKAAPRASGTLKAHYAPRTPLQMVKADEYLTLRGHIPHGERWVFMGFQDTLTQLSSVQQDDNASVVSFSDGEKASLVLYPVSTDPVQYAHDIYALLRRLDEQGFQRICVQALPQDDNWEALNDRLQRAAAAFE